MGELKAEDRSICEETVARAVKEGADLDKLIAIHQRMLDGPGGSRTARARNMRTYSIQLLEAAKP